MSQTSQVAIGGGIGVTVPFGECGEWVVSHGGGFDAGEDGAAVFDDVGDGVAGSQTEGRADRLRNGGLRLRCKSTDDHDMNVRNFLTQSTRSHRP